MKKIIVFVLFFLTHLVVAQQATVNNYKYVVVPSSFKFTKEKDQYRLNTLTKLLLKKYDFNVFLDTDDIPDEVRNLSCNKLYADVENTSNFIYTRLTIVLKDCKNKVLFTSATGQSKEKEFGKAYNAALREAAASLGKLQYHYVPLETIATQKAIEATTETVILSEDFNDTERIVYAQPIPNGFQLVDSTPKVVMKIYKTSNPSAFTAVKGNLQGALVSKDHQWYFEYYQNDQLISEKVNVKF